MPIPDNYDLFVQHDAEQQRQLAKLPKCSWCGERITDDECYEIDDELVCPKCIKGCEVYTENYIEE